MSGSDRSPLESGGFEDVPGRLECGGCGKGMVYGIDLGLEADAQSLMHQDGTPLCVMNDVVIPGPSGSAQRKGLAHARWLGVEPYEERTREPRGIAVLVFVSIILGVILGAAIYAGLRLTGWPA